MGLHTQSPFSRLLLYNVSAPVYTRHRPERTLCVPVENPTLYHHLQPHREKNRAADVTNMAICLRPFLAASPPLWVICIEGT